MTARKSSLSELERMLSEATPGPWSTTDDDGDALIVGGAARDGHDTRIAFMAVWCGPDAVSDAHVRDAALIAASRNALPDLLRIAWAVVGMEPVSGDGSLAYFCPMACGAHTEDEDVESYSAGMVDRLNPTEAEMDLYDARQAEWMARAFAAMKHAEDCAWVLARGMSDDSHR